MQNYKMDLQDIELTIKDITLSVEYYFNEFKKFRALNDRANMMKVAEIGDSEFKKLQYFMNIKKEFLNKNT